MTVTQEDRFWKKYLSAFTFKKVNVVTKKYNSKMALTGPGTAPKLLSTTLCPFTRLPRGTPVTQMHRLSAESNPVPLPESPPEWLKVNTLLCFTQKNEIRRHVSLQQSAHKGEFCCMFPGGTKWTQSMEVTPTDPRRGFLTPSLLKRPSLSCARDKTPWGSFTL